MPRQFGEYRPVSTVDESYNDGYQSGLNWNADWFPGGPYTYKARETDHDMDWIATCNASQENYDAWHRGWKDGYETGKPHAITKTFKRNR